RLGVHVVSKLRQLHHKACRLSFKPTLRLVLPPEMTNRLVNGVTHFLVRLQPYRTALVRWPRTPDSLGDRVTKGAAGVRCFRTVKHQHTVEQGDFRCHLHHFTSRGVERTLGRTDEQPQEYSSHGRDKP